jgi:hypothetical protein
VTGPVPAHWGGRQIDKYSQQFSALKFLLSRDRQHYAALPAIWLRYGLPHLLVIAALASLQWPHLRAAKRAPAHVPD